MKEFNLNNEERPYFGLNPIGENWIEFIIPPGRYDNGPISIYFDGNKIVKTIKARSDSYYENDLDIDTENREYLIPRTARGKKSKLTQANLKNKYVGTDVYLRANEYGIIIANYSTQTTFYSTKREEIYVNSAEEFEAWKRKYIGESTENDITDVTKFKNSKRKKLKYNVGDYFRYKLTRRTYGFGRILENIYKKQKGIDKDSTSYLKTTMGKRLLVALYNYESTSPKIDVSKLNNALQLPSAFIADNRFFFGEYEIIGNVSIKDQELDYPISLSSYPVDGKNCVDFDWGEISKKRHVISNQLAAHINRYINYSLDRDFKKTYTSFEPILKARTIQATDEMRDWSHYFQEHGDSVRMDLRNPEFALLKQEVFRALGLDPNANYADNLRNFN